MKCPKILVVIWLFAIHPAHADDPFTAAVLYAAYSHSVPDANTQKDHDDLEQICTGYLHGLTDALFVMQSLSNSGTRTCMPAAGPIGIQEARVLLEGWLRTHPNTATNSAGIVATMALVYAHKCGG